MTTNPEPAYEHNEGNELSVMPDGFVVYRAASAEVHYLNPSASLIYDLIGEGRTIEQIAVFLKEAFDLPELPLAEVEAGVQNLLTKNIIREC